MPQIHFSTLSSKPTFPLSMARWLNCDTFLNRCDCRNQIQKYPTNCHKITQKRPDRKLSGIRTNSFKERRKCPRIHWFSLCLLFARESQADGENTLSDGLSRILVRGSQEEKNTSFNWNSYLHLQVWMVPNSYYLI